MKRRKSSNIKRVKGRVFEKRWVELVAKEKGPRLFEPTHVIKHITRPDNYGMNAGGPKRKASKKHKRKK